MKRYNPTEIEQKWQDKWEQDGTYTVDLSDHSKPKYYGFSMLPGITGAGIHIGHGRTFQFSDIKVRAKRQQGFNAYHPIGWDSFGLPVENYAIKIGKKPREAHDEAKVNFIKQLKRLGYSYDWTKEISTADPSYYKWTQWIFNQLYKNDLAYQKESPQWWCETDQTVLANEQVEAGRCWRCGNLVVKKNLKQWFFKITEYADEMLEATDALNWTDMVKTMQKNWIGKSQGAEIEFSVADESIEKPNFVILHGFTGRADKNWLPWLKENLEAKGYEVQLPQMPNTDMPVEEDQVGYVLENCTFNKNTILVGHSLGGAVAMKVLQKLPHAIRKLVLVAPVIEPAFRSPNYANENPDKPRTFIETFDLSYDYNDIMAKAPERLILSESQEASKRRPYLEYLSKQIHGQLSEAEGTKSHFTGGEEPFILASILNSLSPIISVFSTRPDTLFGATFMVLAPEHSLVASLTNDDTKETVDAYIEEAARQSEIERMNETREKTGVFTGSYATNPATGEKIPIWIADYVLASYGTGAIMAVPAHDERDLAFAEKFSLPVVQVIAPSVIDPINPPRDDKEDTTRIVAQCLVKHPTEDKYLTLKWSEHDWHTFITGGVEDNEEVIEAAMREITEETGYKNLVHVRTMPLKINSNFYAAHKNVNRNIITTVLEFELKDLERIDQKLEAHESFDVVWTSKKDLKDLEPVSELPFIMDWFNGVNMMHPGEGQLINSGEFTGRRSEEVREEIVDWLEKQGTGRTKTTYKMRDWLISRQRYWGAPIPIIHCGEHGAVAVPDDQLPVILPDVDDFKPKGGATSVLATVEDWVNVPCPTCGKPAKRETDTLDGYACSSWYFLRYIDPFNDTQAWDPEVAKHWEPVDFYNGGDHAVAHLLYSRFWMRFFYKQGWVPDPEPFKRMMYNAYIMAPDGQKMSKSKGNVIDPLEIMDSGYGADSLRVYEMFIAPYDMDAPWDVRGVPGTYRFLNRAWTLTQEYIDAGDVKLDDKAAAEILTIAHKTVKKITEDIEHDKFNTAVSSMMEAVNSYYKLKETHGIGKSDAWKFVIESLLQVLAPFAPHITEELWSELGHENTIHIDTWPEWDDKYLQTDQTTIIVQVNGKLRAKLEVSKDISEEDAKAQALANEHVQKFLENKKPTKVIYVPGRLVNIVV